MSWDPAWRSLVEKLVSEGYESPYLTRLRDRYGVAPGDDATSSLEREILSEMAYALGRAEAKVDVALLRLELAARECEARGDDPASVAAFNQRRDEALRVRRDLMIHREALRFPRDPRFHENYPIPPAREARG
ncbi:MAG: hypothetical protein AB7S26_26285 [Sandaracinaceae bacterium]